MSDFTSFPRQDKFETQIQGEIDPLTTTFNIQTAPGFTIPLGFTVDAVIEPGTSRHEAVRISDIQPDGTVTVQTRGLPIYSGGPSTAVQHGGGSRFIISNNWNTFEDIATSLGSKADLYEDNIFAENNTFQKMLNFSGADGIFRAPNLTEVERDALTPLEGFVLKNTTSGLLEGYIGGAWTDLGGGASTPNGDETTAGKFQLATVAEQITATSLGSTGARLIMANDNNVVTSAGAGDSGKVALLSADGRFDVSVLRGALATLKDEASAATNEIFQNTDSGNANDGPLAYKDDSDIVYDLQKEAVELGDTVVAGDAVGYIFQDTNAGPLTTPNDTYISQTNPATNFDTATSLILDGGGGTEHTALVKFPSIPNLVKLISFDITINVVAGGGGSSFQARTTTSSWNSATVTYNTRPTTGTNLGTLGSGVGLHTTNTGTLTDQEAADIQNNGIEIFNASTGSFTMDSIETPAGTATFFSNIVFVANDGTLRKVDATDGQQALSMVGFVQEGGTAGEFRKIIGHGDSLKTTGLTPGSKYWLDNSGGLSTTPGTFSRIVGVATSSTELQVDLSGFTYLGTVTGQVDGSYAYPPGTQEIHATLLTPITGGASREGGTVMIKRNGVTTALVRGVGNVSTVVSANIQFSGSNYLISSSGGTGTAIANNVYFYG